MKHFVALPLFAALFAACGDDSGSSSAELLKVGCKTETEDNCEYGELVDERDGQLYKTVKIGDQWWMAQNLNFETANTWCGGGSDTSEGDCSKYGRLYTWAAATAACPSGWHLPTKTEFETLLTVVGGSSPTVGCSSTAGAKLKSTSGWNNSGNGSEAYSFSALPAGRRGSVTYSGDFFYLGESADFWSADDDGGYMSLGYRDDGACVWRGAYNYFAYSVRCLKD